MLNEMVDKGRQVGFMVFTIEPLSVPSFEGGLQRKRKEILVGSGLDANSDDYLAVSDTRMVFQKSDI
jgi:hypothetical protein